MSGEFVKAANRSRLYLGSRGDGTVSNSDTRAVLRELASISNPAGVVYAPHTKVAERTGLTTRTVRRAIRRLKADGWLMEVRRGVGNKHGSDPRPSVWVLARLPDAEGTMRPSRGHCLQSWQDWQQQPRSLWHTVRKYERNKWTGAQAHRLAQQDTLALPVDNGPFAEFYKRPVDPLQAASAGHLLNNANEEKKEDEEALAAVAGGQPKHWRQSRSKAALEVLSSE